MGTAFLIKENGVDEIKIEQDRNVCVMSEGIFYCKDPQDIKVTRNFIGWSRLRPLKFRKKTRSVIVWYRGNIYRFDRFCRKRIAEILKM